MMSKKWFFWYLSVVFFGCKPVHIEPRLVLSSSSSSEHDLICSYVVSPICLSIENTFDVPILVIKGDENCIDYSEVLHYNISNLNKVTRFSRGISDSWENKSYDTIAVGEIKTYIIDSFTLLDNIKYEEEISMSKFFYEYKILGVDNKNKLELLVYYNGNTKKLVQADFVIPKFEDEYRLSSKVPFASPPND